MGHLVVAGEGMRESILGRYEPHTSVVDTCNVGSALLRAPVLAW